MITRHHQGCVLNEHDIDPLKPSSVQISRRFPTSRERVFDAWLDPGRVSRFLFATGGNTVADVRIDARVGGAFQITTRNDHEHISHIGIYHVINRPRTLCFSLSVPRFSLQWSRVRVELLSVPGGCELNLFHTQLPRSDLESSKAEWEEMLDRLLTRI
jgi:uncharacterized protein YndB with AHSA1/START domain